MDIKLNTKTVLWIVLGLVVVIVLWQTLQLSSASTAASATQSYGGMVGGC